MSGTPAVLKSQSLAGLLMKFTFASLMLLLVHALIGAPLAAHVTSDAASAEVNPAFGGTQSADGDIALAEVGDAVKAGLVGGGWASVAAIGVLATVPAPVRRFASALPGHHRFDLPVHWGTGDRHALDEGKP